MPVSTKLFLVAPETTKRLRKCLESYRKVRRESVNDQTVELMTSVEDLEISETRIAGTLKFDRVIAVHHRNRVHMVPETVESRFFFDIRSRVRPFLIVLPKDQDIAIAEMNPILSPSLEPCIVTASIRADEIRMFVESRASSIKYCSWRDINIPHLSKTALWGADVGKATQDFRRYNTHGQMNYVMIELADSGWVVAISEEARTIFYSKVPEPDIIEFLEEIVEPLVR